MSFQIKWTLDDGEWSRFAMLVRENGPLSAYDRALRALEDQLYGSVWFMREGRYLSPQDIPLSLMRPHAAGNPKWNDRPDRTSLSNGFDLCLLDLAWQLATSANLQKREVLQPGERVTYSQTDDDFTISFVRLEDSICILSSKSQDQGWALSIPADEFVPGVVQFLRSFAEDLIARIPSFASWTTFSPLLTYRPNE